MLDSIFLIVICDSTSQHGVRFERGRYDLCFTKDTGQKLEENRTGLTGKDIEAQRVILKKFVDKVEMGNKRGKLWYSFPLQEVGLTRLWMIPPKGFEPLSRA